MEKAIFIILFLFYTTLLSQEWVKVNHVFQPAGDYNTYNGVFVDESYGWWLSGGSNGYLWKTSNGGGIWKLIDSSSMRDDDIQFIDTLNGWIVGESLPEHQSYIKITKDGGENWEKHSTPRLTAITMLDSLYGFGGGDSIYATTDGGITWESQSIAAIDSYFWIHDIYFVDKKHGCAVGFGGTATDNGVILKTIDSGKTWQYKVYGATLECYSVYFTDSLNGYVVGYGGAISVTSDGGNSWSTDYLGVPALHDIVFIDDSTGWTVGDNGSIFKTSDKGLSWDKIESGTTSRLNNIYFCNNGDIGYIMGKDATLLKYDRSVGIENSIQSEELSYNLSQNFPNPFNPTATISYQLQYKSHVSLIVYNSIGQVVVELVNQQKEKGIYNVDFDASDLSSGLYIYRLQVNTPDGKENFTQAKKMVLLK